MGVSSGSRRENHQTPYQVEHLGRFGTKNPPLRSPPGREPLGVCVFVSTVV